MSSQDAAVPEVISAETFNPLVGKRLGFAGSEPVFTLDQVERPKTSSDVPRAPFTLIFSAPRGLGLLPEGLHRCAFVDGPVFEFHVAPIHTVSNDRQDYQAVFN